MLKQSHFTVVMYLMAPPAIESTSSMKRTAGAEARAVVNAACSAASPSPTYMLCSWAPERYAKVDCTVPATALAKVVLQHPVCKRVGLPQI